MIVDSHAHIFEKWSGACGLPSRALHWRYIQKVVTRPAAKVIRFRDGAPGDASVLFMGNGYSWSELRDDVQFRVGTYGRLDFTLDGEDYYVQYMPPAMADIESTPELMITQMNAAEVDHCILQAGFGYGAMNDYNALAQHQFRTRFSGLFHVDEPRANEQKWMNEAERAFKQLGLRGLYYSLEQFSRYDFDVWFNEPRFNPFWEMIESHEIPVFIEFSAIPTYDKIGYLDVLKRFSDLSTCFPSIRWLLVMAPPIQYFAEGDTWNFPTEVDELFTRDNILLELCYPITWGGRVDYPFPSIQLLIRNLRDRYGASKLVWGSDMPNVERFCTYKQSIDYIRNYCEFLSSAEKDCILGGNVLDFLGVSKVD
jgi:hypothetical protein